MITVLRRSLKSNAYRAFLWIFLAVMIFGGMSSLDLRDRSKWAIKVYNEKSTDAEWLQSVSSMQRQMDYLKENGINWPRTEPIEKNVLRQMVSSLLMRDTSQGLNLAVPQNILSDQLASTLQSLPEYFFLESGQLNIAMFERVIAPRTFDGFISEIENEAKANLLYSVATIGSYTCKFEVAAQYNEEYADKKYSVLTFSLEKALAEAKKNKVSDETLERFYKKGEHGDLYKTSEKRAGHYWKFDLKHYDLNISKENISSYYENHKKSDYLEAPTQVQVRRIFFTSEHDESFDARKHAQSVHEELIADPTKFEDIAKKIKSAKNKFEGSGKTDFFAKDSNEYDKILVNTAFEQLAKDLDISPVIKTSNGYEILQRISRKPAKYKSLTEVTSKIKEKLSDEKFAKRFKQDAQRLVSNASYNNEALNTFIQKKHGKKESISLETKKTGIVSMQLFQTEQGQYAVFMDGYDGIILECTQVEKRKLKQFAEIKSTIAADYYKKQAHKELETIASKAMKESTEQGFDAIAKSYNAHLESAEFSYNNGNNDQSAILRRPEVMQKIKALQSEGEMIDVISPSESLLIRLDEIAPLDEKIFNDKKTSIENTLASKAKYKGKDSFIASLYRRAKLNNKIKINDQLIKDIKETL